CAALSQLLPHIASEPAGRCYCVPSTAVTLPHQDNSRFFSSLHILFFLDPQYRPPYERVRCLFAAMICLGENAAMAQDNLGTLPENRPYEFDANENKLFQELSSKMHAVGFVIAAIGIIYAISSVVSLLDGKDVLAAGLLGVSALIMLSIGFWTRDASRSFQQIVETSGSDIKHLMGALAKLRNIYSLVYTLVACYVILIGVLVVG